MKFPLGRRGLRNIKSSSWRHDANMKGDDESRRDDPWRAIRYGFGTADETGDPDSDRAPAPDPDHIAPLADRASTYRGNARVAPPIDENSSDSSITGPPTSASDGPISAGAYGSYGRSYGGHENPITHKGSGESGGASSDVSTMGDGLRDDTASKRPPPSRRLRQVAFFAVGLLFGSVTIYACQSLATYLDAPTAERLAMSARNFVSRLDVSVVAAWIGVGGDAAEPETETRQRSPAFAALTVPEAGTALPFDGESDDIRPLSGTSGVLPAASSAAYNDAAMPSTVSRSLTTGPLRPGRSNSGADRQTQGLPSPSEGVASAVHTVDSGDSSGQRAALPGAGAPGELPAPQVTRCRVVSFSGTGGRSRQPISLDRVEIRVAHSWAPDVPTAQRECESRLDRIASLCQHQGGQIVGQRPQCDCLPVDSVDGSNVPLFRCSYTRGQDFACSFSAASAASRRLICD